MFQANPNLEIEIDTRNREQYKVNFACTNAYKNSAVPFCQRRDKDQAEDNNTY